MTDRRSVIRGGSRIFERGGGSGADTGFFTSTPPPLDIARVTSSTFQGGGGRHTHTLDPPLGSILGIQAKKGGKRGSNVKKPTSWPNRFRMDPPLVIDPYSKCRLGVCKRREHNDKSMPGMEDRVCLKRNKVSLLIM